jgi:HEAT repeat protein
MVNTQEIDLLFARTLTGAYEDEAAWDAVKTLQKIGTREVFDRARAWCLSDDPLRRERGADIIGQLRSVPTEKANAFPDEAYDVLTQLVRRETDPRPLSSAIGALGHLDNPAAVPLIANLHSHPDSAVRFNLAFALGCYPEEPLSVDALLQLMRDGDASVRDWATFGLGVLGSRDSSEIREALLVALADANEDVSEEALVGLAKRKDRRVITKLLDKLEGQQPTTRLFEAACEMLGMQSDPEGWTVADYASALRQHFAK